MRNYVEELRKPCPCDGCNHFVVCKTQLRACRQFFHYVNTGQVVHGNKHPTREIWLKIFHDDNLEEENEPT